MNVVRTYAVDSKNLSHVAYDPMRKVLSVMFVAAPEWIYDYRRVGLLKFARLLTAVSIGRYFEIQIRTKPVLHPYTRRKMQQRQ